jgi:hypothetical protein
LHCHKNFVLSNNEGWEKTMDKKGAQIVGLGAALAALAGGTPIAASPAEAAAEPTTRPSSTPVRETPSETRPPNAFFPVGSDLFGLTISENADGTIVADHSSHSSHSSHASHYSSR